MRNQVNLTEDPIVKATAINVVRDVYKRNEAITLLGSDLFLKRMEKKLKFIFFLDTTISKETWAKSAAGTLTGVRKERSKKYNDQKIARVHKWMHEHTSGNLRIFLF